MTPHHPAGAPVAAAKAEAEWAAAAILAELAWRWATGQAERIGGVDVASRASACQPVPGP
jgi:hypothetical protein